jgi:hypothetical protein
MDMKIKWGEPEKESGIENKDQHPEIRALMGRLTEMEPRELAEALFHLESFKDFPQIFTNVSRRSQDQTKLYFSRGLKNEMESIYLDLAKHLRKRSEGSVALMNAVFEFLGKTLLSFIDVPYLTSMN